MLSSCSCLRALSRVCLRKGGRLLVHLRLLVGADEIPVDVLNLRDRGDDLIFKCDIGNLLVVARNAKVPQIRTEAETRQQLLLDA